MLRKKEIKSTEKFQYQLGFKPKMFRILSRCSYYKGTMLMAEEYSTLLVSCPVTVHCWSPVQLQYIAALLSSYRTLLVTCPVASGKLQIANYFLLTANPIMLLEI